ncbi:hypothetical protein SSS_04856 [Sarcoptes scabiei]|uniref:MH2 domain-containing protein n=1 Tax=Sarcoptes scabiei TaxID=52283 RepID=A0A834VHB8_SARSC|nr:hypothetical protein SSS_04856 [Sarcoptes scabiei]
MNSILDEKDQNDQSSDPNSLCTSLSSSSSVDNMISRRRILSRSRDALNTNSSSTDDYSSSDHHHHLHHKNRSDCCNGNANYNNNNNNNNNNSTNNNRTKTTTFLNDQEDCWQNISKLISDHIEEILTKWNQIDDEIWAKVICMERNRRIAKAYARTPILTINGYDVGFDGHRIGLDGFENPMRDKRIQQIKEKIDDGIKIRMDENGDLLVRRLTNIDVFRIFGLNLKSLKKVEPNFKTCKIEPKKSVLLFDMKEFHQNLLNELKSPISNRRMLEQKCFSFVSFGSVSDHDLLDTPVWCIIINLVALETLIRLIPKNNCFYSTLPSTMLVGGKNLLCPQNNLINEFEKYPPNAMIDDDDDDGKIDRRDPIPPKLPPRDLNNKKPPLTLPEPDYDNDTDYDKETNVINKSGIVTKSFPIKNDDPYYHGLTAHVPKYNQQMFDPRPAPITNRFNPPIRKALTRKYWNSLQQQQTNSGIGCEMNGHSTNRPQSLSSPQFVQSYLSSPRDGWEYPSTRNEFNPKRSMMMMNMFNDPHSTSSSSASPMTSLMSPMLGHRYPNRFIDYFDSAPLSLPPQSSTPSPLISNDNNEIYGINANLMLRKNNQSIFNRSTSSPSLKNIFSRKKNTSNSNNGPNSMTQSNQQKEGNEKI